MPMAMLVMIALPCLAADAVAQDESPTMPGLEYTSAVAELLGYEHGPITTEAPRRAVPLFDGWTRTIVAPEFRPPAGAPRLVHLGDGHTCDSIAADYSVGGRPVRVVQTYFLFAMELRNSEQPPTLDAARQTVPQMLAVLLREADKLDVSVEAMDEGFCGRQPQRPLMPDGRWDHLKMNWTDTVHWWLSEGALRVVCVKVQPRMSLLPSGSRKGNLNWFRFYDPAPEQ